MESHHNHFASRNCGSRTAIAIASISVLLLACSGTSTSSGEAAGGLSSGGNSPSSGGASNTAGAPGAGGTSSNGGSTISFGGTASGGASSNGGSTSVGGTTSKGGNSNAGGAKSSGGATSAGGINAAGGNIGVGGASTSGGAKATGGSNSAGGAANTGGLQATGGNLTTGGAKNTGGATNTGGTNSTGGSKATGGFAATGGVKATGGNQGTGGASNACGSPVATGTTLLSSCTGTSPITCALTAANGNWDVTVELGDPASAGSSRVQSETRHYENSETATAAGAYSTLTFTANVRAEVHDGGQSAPGNILNLVIDGSAPKLHALGIRSSSCAITIFIAGDSTVCDWVSTNTSALAADETGWAQELSLYMKPGVSVANYADSGETAGSFYTKFFPAARTAMKAGDYLFIQFGHNDQKNATDIANYPTNLTNYVNDAKAKGAIPVIVTPVSRASGSAANPGFAGLDQVARDTATQLGVALIDLTALSRSYYTTVPNFSSTLFIDGTHFHEVGAIGVAGVVANAIKSSSLGLSSYVR